MAPSRIPLAVRLPNWVGDVCMALPALAALHDAGFVVHALGRAWAADLLAATPYRVVPAPSGIWRTAATLRECGARVGVLLTNSFASALAMRLAGIDAAGYGGQLRTPLLTRAVARLGGEHEVEAFWRLAAAVIDDEPAWPHHASAVAPPPRELALAVTPAQAAAADAALAGLDGVTVVAPLAVGSARGRSKRWPGFPEITRRLIDAGRVVVACPGPGEEAETAAAAPGARLLPGLGLGAYAAVMARARAVIANDSGPMHLAAAVGAAVVGVFGVSDPRRTRPWGRRARALGSAAGWPSVDAVWAAL